jgi:Concanavalin A-like lectin/glucanases superfamily
MARLSRLDSISRYDHMCLVVEATNRSRSLIKLASFPRPSHRPRSLAAACGLFMVLTALPAHAQTCAPQPSGMVAWWPLDGSPNDIVGNNNPSSITGVTYQPGQVLQGATFSQTTPLGGILIPEGTLTPQKFTVDAWVKATGPSPDPNPPNNDPHGSYIVAKPWNAYWPTIALTWTAYTYTFRFDFGSAVSPLPVSQRFIDSAHGGIGTAGPVNYGPDGKFHLVTGTYDGATYRLYVDGDLKGFVDDATPVNYNGMPWTIGTNVVSAAGPYYRTFNGVIDEVEIFDRALDQSEIQAIYAAGTAGKCKPRGMTWRLGAINPIGGTVTVGCGSSAANPCNPYLGDHPCTDSLPLLCFKPFNPILSVPMSVIDTDFYNRWSGGIIGTTAPVPASLFGVRTPGSLANANARCAQEFGSPDWRVAEFHDGAKGAGGWNFQAYGNVGNPSSRFWVHINDQPKGTCWK